MAKALTARNLLEKRPGRTIRLTNEHLSEAVGAPEARGCWLIYGSEKNGKTWFSLTMAKDIAKNERVAYISAEEGTDMSFQNAVTRAGITPADKIVFEEYMTIEEIVEKYGKPKTARVLFIDNLTIYPDELKSVGVRDFMNRLPNKLIVFVAHEERKEPYPACARMAKKLAKVFVHVQGLRANVVSRFAKGGTIVIDIEKSEMCWGAEELVEY